MICNKVRESFLWSVNFHQKRIAMKNERQKNSNETKFKTTRFYSTFFGAEYWNMEWNDGMENGMEQWTYTVAGTHVTGPAHRHASIS